MSSPDRNSLKIRKLSWNYLEDFKNCRMKWIAWMIPRIFKMLSRFAVEIHTFPVHQDCSLNILHLKGCWGLRSLRSDKRGAAQCLGNIRHIRKRFCTSTCFLRLLYILRNGILLGRKLLKNQFTCLQRRKVEDQNETRIWDASPDRQPKIQSSSVEETLQRIMGQTNNDCRFRTFILTSSLHQQPLRAGR